MKELVDAFTSQLREALAIATKAELHPKAAIENVIITGLGGSGIGGAIVAELVANDCPVPVIINKDYHLPAFTSPRTLVIVSSYSGNTEETLSAMSQAIDRKAQVVCITSGGRVLELAKEHGFDHIIIPGGNPPRSCIGYSLVQLIRIFEANKLVPSTMLDQVKRAVELLDAENKNIKEEAMKVAKTLHGKLPVIYSLGAEAVSIRFRQQLNENAKMLCWHQVLPEMNHNELVGWAEANKELAVVTFHTADDYTRTQKRYEVCLPIFEKQAASVTDIHAKGTSKTEQFFYLINLGDWISCYLADLKGIDAVEVDVITHLKNELAKF
jgi:glucose/mannose-6-phosphate isomerase